MIPKIIHYCWFGDAEMPELAQHCIASWHEHMSDWEYVLWNEENFDINAAPAYVREAYSAKKYAFVSDYVRLYALEQTGGVYLDVDVEVIRSYESLLNNKAFIGFEDSKHKALGTNCIGSEAHMLWLKELLQHYEQTHFANPDGTFDMTTNSELIAHYYEKLGLVRNGKEQLVQDIHVYDYHYFSPITSTRVMRKNENTYSIHHLAGSWTEEKSCRRLENVIVREIINALAQVKRFILN